MEELDHRVAERRAVEHHFDPPHAADGVCVPGGGGLQDCALGRGYGPVHRVVLQGHGYELGVARAHQRGGRRPDCGRQLRLPGAQQPDAVRGVGRASAEEVVGDWGPFGAKLQAHWERQGFHIHASPDCRRRDPNNVGVVAKISSLVPKRASSSQADITFHTRRYNSVIFTSEAGMSYNLIAVEKSFLSGSQFSNASSSNSAGLTREALQKLQGAALAGDDEQLTNLTVSECIYVFTGAFNADYQNLLLVVNDNSNNANDQNSLVATARAGIGESPSNAQNLASTSNSNSQILVDGAQVQFCLGQATPADQEVCTLKLNGVLLAVLLGLHLITLFSTAASLLLARFEPLVTLGDALSSFLRDPDPTTRMNGLLTKENIRTDMGGWGFTEGKYWVPQRDHRLFRSGSLTQWLVAGFWWILTLCLVAGVLALTIANSTVSTSNSSSTTTTTTTSTPTTMTTLSRFGVPSAHTTYLLDSASSASMSGSLLAIITSIPQFLLAGLYFSTNALLTAFFLTRESSLYAILYADGGRRPLRVSADPQGHQITSLYLTLPRPISWALAIWFAAMGWVLSQSCFVVDITSSSSTKLLGVGFSSSAILLLLLMLVILLFAVLGLAFLCKAPSAIQSTGQAIGNPLVFEGGSCSAVMSARCHRIPGETDVWKNHLCWGVVPEMGDAPTSHVTYSARPLMEMDGHHCYV